MGLDVYLEGDGIGEQVWDDSKTDPERSRMFPDHYWRQNYLRSSYNEGGYNHVVGALIGKDLYWVFEPMMHGDDEYEFEPTKQELAECRRRAEQVERELAAIDETASGITFVSMNPFSKPDDYDAINSDEAAMKLYRETVAQHTPGPFGDSGFGNKSGEFYPSDPLTVRAFIHGKGPLGNYGTYAIYDRDLSHYKQASTITLEFIDRAMSVDHPVIHWSA